MFCLGTRMDEIRPLVGGFSGPVWYNVFAADLGQHRRAVPSLWASAFDRAGAIYYSDYRLVVLIAKVG